MPVIPTTIAGAIKAAAPELQGPAFGQLALAVGMGVAQWVAVPGNVLVQGVTTGIAGGGTVTGTITVPPNPGAVSGTFASAGLLGPNSASLIKAIGVGVPAAFTAEALYLGASVGVGSGSDISKITVANPTTLIPLITSNAASVGLAGPDTTRLAVAIGNGVAALLLAGTGIGAVAGPGGPVPGAGTSTSRIV